MVLKMDLSGIEETRKVSFDDLVSESIAGPGDESSVEGLVSVLEDYPLHSESFPLLPTIYGSAPGTPDVYSCFAPPQNPEQMRRRPRYPTIIPSPDYCSIYSKYNWRRVSFETIGSKRRRVHDDESNHHDGSTNFAGYRFRALLRRFASCMKRSEDSRRNIIRHRTELHEILHLDKDVKEALSNDTRRRVLDMVRHELSHQAEGEEDERSRDIGEDESQRDKCFLS